MSTSKFKKPVSLQPVAVKQEKSFFENSEAWLGKRQRQILTVIVVVAVFFRIVYFVQLNSGPSIWQHRYSETDMHFYDEWAKIISRGNWLSDVSFHQYDITHQWIADYYFKTHPDEAVQLQKQLGNDKSPQALGRLLWHRWDGGKMFHQDPLYIYMVAVIYKIFGEDVRYVFMLQMMIGIGSILLIYFISRKYFGNTAALVSGTLAVFCGPLMFYELVLVRESIIVFAGLLLVFLMDKAFENVSIKNFLILGVAIAFCILLKSIFVLFLFLTVAISFFVFKTQLKLFVRYAGVLLLGAFLIYTPLLIRNSIIGVPIFTQNAIGSISVIAANDVNYQPEESYELNIKNTTDIIAATGGKTLPSLISSIKTHPDLISYFTLLAKKFVLIFHWYEFPNNKNFYYYRLHAPVLGFTFVSMLLIAQLALVGIVVAIIQKKKLWSLYLLLLMHLFLLIMFIVLSRYRIPFEAALIPFAGFAVAELIKNFNTKIKYVMLLVAGIISLAFFVGRPLPQNITLIRGVDYDQPYNFYYKQIIDKHIKDKNYKDAVNTMELFMKLEPNDVKQLSVSSIDLNSYQMVLAKVYAKFHEIYYSYLQLAGDDEQALIEKNRADELQQLVMMNDNSGSLESLLAKASAAPPDQKPKMYRELIGPLWNEIKLNPNNFGPYQALNDVYLNLNMPDSSIFILQQLLNQNENDFYANFQLGTIYGKYKNDFEKAILYLEKAKSINPKIEDVYINLGIVYSILQQNEKAVEMMNKAAEINPKNKNNVTNLELLLRKLGRNAEADEVKKRM